MSNNFDYWEHTKVEYGPRPITTDFKTFGKEYKEWRLGSSWINSNDIKPEIVVDKKGLDIRELFLNKIFDNYVIFTTAVSRVGINYVFGEIDSIPVLLEFRLEGKGSRQIISWKYGPPSKRRFDIFIYSPEVEKVVDKVRSNFYSYLEEIAPFKHYKLHESVGLMTIDSEKRILKHGIYNEGDTNIKAIDMGPEAQFNKSQILLAAIELIDRIDVRSGHKFSGKYTHKIITDSGVTVSKEEFNDAIAELVDLEWIELDYEPYKINK